MTQAAPFVWYELATSDKPAAERFYAQVAGWKTSPAPMPGMDYAIITAPEAQPACDTAIGGIMTMPGEMPPFWFGYVAVPDVDAWTEKVKAAGGALHKGPADIPQVGRFAIVADPQGAVFVLFKGAGEMPPAAPYMSRGTIGWHELHTSDAEAAFDFYAGLFGWAKDEALDMGAMGIYQLIRTGNPAPGATGAMFNSPHAPRPMWLYYVSIDDIDAAKTRIEAGGGRIANGPMEVPGGMWVVQATDPQGAMFAVVGPRKG